MLLTCQEVMKRPLVTVTEQDDLGLVMAIFAHRGFRHVPVVRGDKLVGLLSQRDLLQLGIHPGSPEAARRVGEVMVRPVKTVRARTPVRHAARLMAASRFSCLPVIEEGGALLGMITETDLVSLAADLAEEADRADAEICRGD